MRLPFIKMQSLGNDFVMLDGITHPIQLSKGTAKKLADRHFGIGCDQILLAQPSAKDKRGVFLRIFNQDGSEVGQCGNGARCFARFLQHRKLTDRSLIAVHTQTTSMQLKVNDDDTVTVGLENPIFVPDEIPFVAPEEKLTYSLETSVGRFAVAVLSVGNPHAVQVVDDVTGTRVKKVGRVIERHHRFPERVNVGFMQVRSRKHIRLRVFERGVGETLGCGSGACAAVVSGIRWGLLDSEVVVSLPGGNAVVRWEGMTEPVYLTGTAETVFEGVIEI